MTLKRRERLVITIAVTAFVAVAIFLIVILPAMQQVRIARKEAERKQAEFARLIALVDQRPQIEQRHVAVGAAARALEARLPRDPALPLFVAQLDGALTSSRVQLRQITFDPIPVSSSGSEGLPAGMAAVPMRLQVSGDYPRLRAFVAALERVPRSVAVDRLAVTAVQNGIVADLTLRAFYAP